MAVKSSKRRWRPPPPPAGTYDPALDAQQAAAGRGLLDLTQDIGSANLRDTVDYGLSRDDLIRGRDRGFEDVDRSRSRGTDDYSRAVSMLQQSYARLGNRQAQSMRSFGVSRGGAALQAAQKRTANEAQDRQPLDTSFTRLNQDLDLNRDRLTQDTDLSLGRLALMQAPPDATNPFGGRAFQDRTTQMTRAQRENTHFGLDLGEQRAFQAGQAGWTPPPKPAAQNPYDRKASKRYSPRRSLGWWGG